MKLYFHGTEKKNLKKILKEGLKVKYGRATLTKNLLYTASYSSKKTWGSTKKLDKNPITKEGMFIVFNDSNNKIKLAKESFILINKKKRIITGWPNRFKTEQFGYFKSGNLPNKEIIGAYSYSINLLKLLEQIDKEIASGKINSKYIENCSIKLEKILKDIELMESKASLKVIADSILFGMIRNKVLREIRTAYLSKFALNGWKIENYGGHPVKLKEAAQIRPSIFALQRIINKSFVTKDIKREFLQRLK